MHIRQRALFSLYYMLLLPLLSPKHLTTQGAIILLDRQRNVLLKSKYFCPPADLEWIPSLNHIVSCKTFF